MGHTGSLLRLHVVPFKTFQPVKNVWALTKPAQRARLERQLHIRQQVFDAFDQLADPPEGSRRLRCSPPAARLRAGPRSNRAVAPAAMRVNQTDATAVRRREGMPSGFVNCAAHYIAPLRLVRMLRVGSKNLAASVPPGRCSRRKLRLVRNSRSTPPSLWLSQSYGNDLNLSLNHLIFGGSII